MTVLSRKNPTLVDFAKNLDPQGNSARIVEILNETNAILDDMVWIMANGSTGHRTTIRTGLATPYWRLLNKGTPESTTTEAQVDEGIGLLVSRSAVDVKLASLNGNSLEFRMSRAKGHMEGMSQEMASTLFYGNTGTSPEEFTGLSTRYSSLSAGNAQNILDAGGTGSDNSSIWLIVWNEDTVHGIFPKGSKAGLEHDNIGVGDAFDADGNRFRAYLDEWSWSAGLAVEDWRYAVRICNIDISNLIAKSSAADLIEFMIKAIHRIPSLQKGRAAFYMNRTVIQMLDIQKRDDVISGGGLVYKDADGIPIMTFRGIPVKMCDELLETEARIT